MRQSEHEGCSEKEGDIEEEAGDESEDDEKVIQFSTPQQIQRSESY